MIDKYKGGKGTKKEKSRENPFLLLRRHICTLEVTQCKGKEKILQSREVNKQETGNTWRDQETESLNKKETKLSTTIICRNSGASINFTIM